MKKTMMIAASLLALAACEQSTIPDSGAGVGFDDYTQYELERAQREAQLRGRPATPVIATDGSIVTPGAPTPTNLPNVQEQGVGSDELAAAGIAPQTTQAGDPGATVPLGQNPGISDEQDFDAVSGRESIESDAERRARQAAAYQLMEVTALPDRDGNIGPNIVQYALQAPNDKGESVFDRSGFNAQARFERNCAKYRTPDEAQRDFLTRGGPQRDRLGLDPDGDGFACGWDPQAFRSITTGN